MRHSLVTGSSGALGSQLVPFLTKQGERVQANRIDMRDSQGFQNAFNQPYDTVYHLAALNPFKRNQGLDYFLTNVQGVETLLKEALKAHCKASILITSTALVFEPEKLKQPVKQTKLLAEDVLTPFFEKTLQAINFHKGNADHLSTRLLQHFNVKPEDIFYNDSKLLAEIIAYAYQKLGLKVKVVRLANCIGRNSHQLPNQFIQDLHKYAAIRFDNKDTQARDYLFYSSENSKDDVLRLLVGINQKGSSGFYHIASKGQFVRTPKQWAEAIYNYFGVKPVMQGAPDNNQTITLDAHKIKALGLRPPQTSPESALSLLC